MLKTSYFARNGKVTGAVSIALKSPFWFKGQRYPDLAPTQEMLAIEDWDEYTRRYNDEILSRLDPKKVLDDLKVAITDHDIIILCWEKDRSACHRGLVAQWFERTMGFEVPEAEIPGKTVTGRTSIQNPLKTAPILSEPEIMDMVGKSGGRINPYPVTSLGYDKNYRILDICWDIPDSASKTDFTKMDKIKKTVAQTLEKNGWEVDTENIHGFFFSDGIQYSLQAKKLKGR